MRLQTRRLSPRMTIRDCGCAASEDAPGKERETMLATRLVKSRYRIVPLLLILTVVCEAQAPRPEPVTDQERLCKGLPPVPSSCSYCKFVPSCDSRPRTIRQAKKREAVHDPTVVCGTLSGT